MTFRFLFLPSIIVAILCSLGACSTISFMNSQAKSPLRYVSIEAIENANQNQATAVDIVLIYDSNMLSVLPKSAPEWFANKSTLLAGFGQSIEVVSLQMPTSSVTSVTLPKDIFKAVQVLSYANYISPEGQVSGNLTSYKCVRIVLQVQHAIYAACS
jgi:type VI secretion system protein